MSELSLSMSKAELVSTVVDKVEYDKFVEQVKVAEEMTDKRLTDVEAQSMSNKDEFINQKLGVKMLNDWLMIEYNDQIALEGKVKALIISNIITGLVAVAGVILAILL